MDVDARLNMVDLPAKQDLVLFVSMVESKLFHLRNGEQVQPASNTGRWGLKRTAEEAGFRVQVCFFFFFVSFCFMQALQRGANTEICGQQWQQIARPKELKAVQVRFTAVGVLTLQAGSFMLYGVEHVASRGMSFF
ncbi:MAG: hypothetical protein OIF58_00490 [Cohaesibacter sp.]|nr:hypothetical protein [Cohaesibacter sp.]